MLHHFTIKVASDQIDQIIENLNAVGIYYIHYEQPFAVTTTEYGYGLEKKEEKELDLNIYAEEDDVPGLPEAYFEILQKVLSLQRKEIHYSTIKEEDWQQPFIDIDLENGWVICTPESASIYSEELHKIILDPQGAFGTGLHGTTQDCLRIILDRDFSGKKVLDLGTGSGILSIAARLKGADSVTAIDIEPVEREINYNASLNGINQIKVIQQDIFNTEIPVSKYNPLFINIGGEETLQFLDQHHMLERYDGHYLISGLVEWSVDKILAPFLNANYIVEERRQTGEWVTVFLVKR